MLRTVHLALTATALSLAIVGLVTDSPIPPVLSSVVILGYFVWQSQQGPPQFTAKKEKVLSKTEFAEFPLKEKIIISHNTAIYRFSLPTPLSVLGLPVGQHITVAAKVGEKDVQRSYTPVSNDDEPGHFDLLIKSYEQGILSALFTKLQIGDPIRVKGPKGAFQYSPNCLKKVGMIAGGTGITPMLQIIKAVLRNPSDSTQLSLIYANVTSQDILLKSELDELAAVHPQRFSVYYVLNQPPADWTGGVGFVTKDMIAQYCPTPAEDGVKILLCGPPPMVSAMAAHTESLGFPKSNALSKMVDVVFKF